MDKFEYIYGKNSCRAALKSNSSIKGCFLTNSFKDEEIISLLKNKNVIVKKVNNQYLDKMFNGGVHQGIALKIEPYAYSSLDDILKLCENKKDALVLLLDGLEDPQNFGSIIRSCDAFGVDAIIIPSSRSVSVTASVVKVSTGAIEYVPICKVSNLNQTIDILKQNNFWVVASDGNGTDLYDKIDYNMKTALIVGSEGKGISQLTLKKSDFIVKIPLVGHVNSLNASVATGVLLAMIQKLRSN